MTIRTRSKAIEAAKATKTNVPGTCQKVTRGWFNAPSAGDQDGDGDADAVDGWKSEPPEARIYSRTPPPGFPVAFKGGSKGYGHRAISVGDGMCISTDMYNGKYTPGVTGYATISQIERTMGVQYLGASRTIDGYPIPPEPEVWTRGKNVDHALEDLKLAKKKAGPIRKVRLKAIIQSIRNTIPKKPKK